MNVRIEWQQKGDKLAHGDITHIDIPVDDMARAVSFYGSVFGWQIAEIEGHEGYPMWQAPNEISGGGLALRDDSLKTMRSYVEVDSIEDVVAKATEAGGDVVMEKTPISEGSWYAVISDTEGNQVGLYEGTTG
jgi:predicted enzyme related to lactoylglutathione lyase